ncbi:MAG: hypothetical protein QM820_20700 [Minicystis sp.]
MPPAPPRPPDDDREAKGIRFGCGALLGFVLGLGAVVQLAPKSMVVAVVAAVAIAVIFGFLSARYGERFWDSLPDWIRWW